MRCGSFYITTLVWTLKIFQGCERDVEDCIRQPLDSSNTTNFILDSASKTLVYNTSSHRYFASISHLFHISASHLRFATSINNNTCSSNLTFQIWFESYSVHVKRHAIKSCNVQQMKRHSMNSLTFDLKSLHTPPLISEELVNIASSTICVDCCSPSWNSSHWYLFLHLVGLDWSGIHRCSYF